MITTVNATITNKETNVSEYYQFSLSAIGPDSATAKAQTVIYTKLLNSYGYLKSDISWEEKYNCVGVDFSDYPHITIVRAKVTRGLPKRVLSSVNAT